MGVSRDVAYGTIAAEWVAFAQELAEAAAAEILPRFRQDLGVENKLDRGFDPVTEADRAAETAMRALITARYPDHSIYGEELGAQIGKGPIAWSLDPIDGTRAFISGLPLWGVLIALLDEGQPALGVIDQPYLQERFIGWGGGAHALIRGEHRALRTRECAHLRDAILSTTDPHLFSGAEAGGFEQVRATAKMTRFGCDCYAYAMLAMGKIDMVIESGLKPHDVHALIPVIEGAGGIITNWRGDPCKSGGQVIAAGDPRIHRQALVALRRAAN